MAGTAGYLEKIKILPHTIHKQFQMVLTADKRQNYRFIQGKKNYLDVKAQNKDKFIYHKVKERREWLQNI